ncbi:WD40/YVTN/BNR-like repeat-containing protein [Spirillospora albida]|uniref:WD40/YVTN/BNR-like repeat-containing protein n=1 Tax=Spirillospora albida TaxID=58123 RepID=UPI0004C247F8|nr:hypothetical protein [Spirillospora albida]
MRPALRTRIAALAAAAGLLTAPALTAVPAAADEPKAFAPSPAPLLWPRSGIEAVSATGPNDVWAAAYQGYQGIDWSIPMFGAGTIRVLPPKPAVVRWNGSSWRTYDLPGAGGDGVIDEISAGSPANVWVIGRIRPQSSGGDRAPYLARWDGTRWQEVQRPPGGCHLSDPAADATGAWFSCGGDVWRWQNGTWTEPETGGLGRFVQEISLSPDGTVWAATASGLIRGDGGTWTRVPGFADVDWYRVLAVSATEVYATGWNRPPDSTVSTPVAVRWDGRAWHDLPVPPSGERLIKTGDGTLWALDEFNWGGLHRLTGDTWTRVRLPVPAQSFISGGTAVPGTSALWVVGKTKDVPIVVTNR